MLSTHRLHLRNSFVSPTQRPVLTSVLQLKMNGNQLVEYQRIEGTLKAIKSQCRLTNTMYTDQDFPPKYTSVVGADADRRTKQKFSNVVTCWKRPESMSIRGNGTWAVINKDAGIAGIKQGQLGNCWFIAAVALLAERRKLLGNIFVNQNYNKAGVYALQLCVDGVWKGIIVDNYFPCNASGQMAFSRCSNMQIWVPLIEKAMAKVFGGYAALTAGHVAESLNYLTGFYTTNISFKREKDKDKLFNQLLENHKSNFLMGAHITTNDEQETKRLKAVGLITNHVYSVLRIVNTQSVKLVQLRNPWGNFSWKGKWSDRDSSWTRQLSAELQPNKSSEGIFWMEFSEFTGIFNGLEMCKVRDNWFTYGASCVLPPFADAGPQRCFEFSCADSTQVDASFYQTSRRGKEEIPRTDIGFIILTKSADGSCIPIKVVRSHRFRVVSGEVTLRTGDYIIVPFSFGHWTEDPNTQMFYPVSITIHSSKALQGFVAASRPHILVDAIIETANKFGKKSRVVSTSDDIQQIALNLGTSNCVVVSNSSANQALDIKVNVTATNYTTTRGSFSTRDLVPPQHCYIVNLLTIEKDENMSQYQTSFMYGLKGASPNSSELHTPSVSNTLKGFHIARKTRSTHGAINNTRGGGRKTQS